MKKIKFLLPVLLVIAIVGFAFGNIMSTGKKATKRLSAIEKNYSTTFFVFTGNSTAEYANPSKWVKYTSNPEPACPGDEIACLVSSTIISTVADLVAEIDNNGGIIAGKLTMEDKKAIEDD